MSEFPPKTRSLRATAFEVLFERRPLLPLIVIALLGLLAYSNTFDVPFQMDDRHFFSKKNPVISDLSSYIEPSKTKGHILHDALVTRYVGYLSFAVNYKVHGLDVRGYHIANFVIHVLNSMLVYFLVVYTFKTPFLLNSRLSGSAGYVALFTGMLFVTHPIQTEAVTYVFQRLASFMSFFYLMSIVFYIRWRLEGERRSGGSDFIAFWKDNLLYIMSLIAAIAAMKTKENAFTLPFVVMLYEFLFFEGAFKRRFLILAPHILTLLIIPATIIGFDSPIAEAISGIGYSGIPRGDYLFTQMRVVVTYIRLLLFPVNQNFYYDYPIYHSFLTPEVFLSFLFLFCVGVLGVCLFQRSRFKSPELRITAFGIFWFFIVLSVESSIIPVQMVINEYRVYLPSAGALMAVTTGVFMLAEMFGGRRAKAAAMVALAILPLLFAFATYERNMVWQNRITLLEDVVKKSPRNADMHYHLAANYRERGMEDKAIEHYTEAIKLRPTFAEAYSDLGNIYLLKGRLEEAVSHFLKGLEANPSLPEAHYNLGNAYRVKGLIDEAISEYRAALKYRPSFAEAHSNLATAYWFKGNPDRSIEHYKAALKINPDSPEIHYNLAVVYGSRGMLDGEIEHYMMALRLRPGYTEARANLDLAVRKKKGQTK